MADILPSPRRLGREKLQSPMACSSKDDCARSVAPRPSHPQRVILSGLFLHELQVDGSVAELQVDGGILEV
jgi:hypothetical protein